MKLGGFSKDIKNGLAVILDIGSGSVGGALVSFSENKKPKILFSVRKPIVFQNDFKFERFLLSMLKAIDQVLDELGKAKLGKPKQVFCILAAPWYVSQARTIVFEKEKTFSVTPKRVDNLISREVESLKKNFDAHYKDLTESKAEIIEVENINMKLNGYETRLPYDKKAKRLEAHLYVSMSAGQVLQALRQKVRKELGLDNVFFNSFSLAAFDTIRDMYSQKQNFIFIDVGGEMTDVSVVRNGILVETESFPLGKNFLIRTVASELQTENVEALSSFGLYMEDKMANAGKRKIQSALTHVEEEWGEALYKTLGSIATHITIPGTVFIIADIPFGKWFSEVIRGKGSGNIMLMGERIETIIINPLVLSKFAAFDLKVDKDAFIITESLFIDKLLKSKI